jgi:peptide chain release factor 3
VRLADEYGLDMSWDVPEFELARWIKAPDQKTLDSFVAAHRSAIAEDLDGDVVFLARNAFNLDYTGKQNAGMTFIDVKDLQARKAAAS